ncbi:MAG TPA: phenylalanine--tRNA ligase subunit beta [Dermatophilaceae bacterium]|nr:phenylalanine--tRNA ligase subunit beta [Dermatophilaceae bacterium]
MRAPLSWLGEYVDGAASASGADVAAALVRMGLEEEALHGGDVTGPIVVGRVLSFVDEQQKNGKLIRWCQVDVGEPEPTGVVCGAHNFAVDDLVVVVRPGATLPGGLLVGARKTYGHVSQGMICSERELGLGADHEGILVLTDYLGAEAAELKPGADAVALLGLAEEVVEVAVTPDRGYCFSLRGMAREYAHATGGAFHDPADPAAVAVPEANDDGYAVELTDSAPIQGRPGCDRFVARVVRGVDASAPSPAWLARRLTQVGMRPISLAVDVTNYLMLALGQPLHAYDLDTLSGSIVVRRARAGETLTTLDGVERRLDPEDLLITGAAGEQVLGIAGVMGGAACEVGASTRNVLLEAAHFDPVTIARSSRRHKLFTEASKRFERGVDPALPTSAAQLAVDLLVRYGGGTVDDGVTDVDRRVPVAPVLLDTTVPARLVGLPYTREEVVGSLREIGCTVTDRPGEADLVSVLPPSWRPDLAGGHGPDFAEEVARLRGYDRIPSVLPRATPGRGLSHEQRVLRTVAQTLAGRGLVEVLTYPFVAATIADDMGLPTEDPRRRAVRVTNPLSEQAPLMRTSLLSTLLDAVRRNLSRGARDVAVFEIGHVVRPTGDRAAPVPPIGAMPPPATMDRIAAAVPPQPKRLAIAMCGLAEPAGWWGPGRPVDWSDAVAAARAAATALDVVVQVSADDHAPWHPGRCARLSAPDGTLVGHAGELHPKVASRLGLPAGTVAAELDLPVLVAASDHRTRARKLSTFPLALSDVALVVGEEVPAGQVEAALVRGAGPQLESIALFDVYRGDQVPAGRRSLAYRLEFRADDRTLTTEEVSALRDRAVAEAETATGAVLRGT